MIVVALLLGGQSLAARSGSASWDFGLLLPASVSVGLFVLVLLRSLKGRRLLERPLVRGFAIGLVSVGLAVFLCVEVLLVAAPLVFGAPQLDEMSVEAPFLIVLGCGINADGSPSWALENRLEAALTWYRAHPGTRMVVSGGQGANEPMPEALAMSRYLFAHGAAEADVFLEDRSTSTMENFQYSIPILRNAGWKGEPILFSTNDFHLFRARMLAGRNGLDAYGLPSPTPAIIRPNVYLREFFALFKSLLMDWPPADPAPAAAR